MKKNLGFGWMRLPQLSEDPTNIDFDQVKQMVDTFLDVGFNYFDTSFVYHNGHSENAIKKCLVERHPRERYMLASKLPVFSIQKEEEVVQIFNQQLENCGVEYFDYFLLHNMNIHHYNSVVKSCKMFEHMQEWKKAGKIKHIAISFHDSADVLDLILNEHPEIEVVQIALNYYDWNSTFIQAKACYEVIRKHQKQVIIMEPVKGGMLASSPKNSNLTADASLALRFCGELDSVLAILSGMSNLTQVKQNIESMKDFQPLSTEEKELIEKLTVAYKQGGPLGHIDFDQYKDVKPHGISLASLLETYNSCMIQPNPGFAAELNYYSIEKAKNHLLLKDSSLEVEDEKLNQLIKEADDFLANHSFANYDSKLK